MKLQQFATKNCVLFTHQKILRSMFPYSWIFALKHTIDPRPKLDNSKLGSTQQQKIRWHWHVARIISSQKIYGLYARKHHIVEMRGDVTDAGRPTTTEDIELLSQWKLEAESRNYFGPYQYLVEFDEYWGEPLTATSPTGVMWTNNWT